MYSCNRIFAFVLVATVWLLPAWAQPTTLPGTSISVDIPPGFGVSDQFTGLQNLQTGASFLFAELPAGAEQDLGDVFQNLTTAADAFRGQGITLRQEVALDTRQTGFPAFHGTQTVGDTDYIKWVSLFIGENAMIVTYQSPPPGDTETLIIETLESIRIGTPLTLAEKVDALPYRLGSTGEMRIVNVFSGNAAILTIGERDVDPQGEQPILIIASSLGDVPVSSQDRIAYSTSLLGRVANLSIERLLEQEETIVAGWEGVRLAALAKSTTSGRDIHIVQWIGFSGSGYLRVVAQAPVETWEDVRSHFEAVVKGLQQPD